MRVPRNCACRSTRGRSRRRDPWVIDRPTATATGNARRLPELHAVRTHVAGVLRATRMWRRGADAEHGSAEWLGRLPEGWFVFHDVPLGERGATVDHVVIGPGGVFTLNTEGPVRGDPGERAERRSRRASHELPGEGVGRSAPSREPPDRCARSTGGGPGAPRDPRRRMDREPTPRRCLRRRPGKREALDAAAAAGPPPERCDRPRRRGLEAGHVGRPAGTIEGGSDDPWSLRPGRTTCGRPGLASSRFAVCS